MKSTASLASQVVIILVWRTSILTSHDNSMQHTHANKCTSLPTLAISHVFRLWSFNSYSNDVTTRISLHPPQVHDLAVSSYIIIAIKGWLGFTNICLQEVQDYAVLSIEYYSTWGVRLHTESVIHLKSRQNEFYGVWFHWTCEILFVLATAVSRRPLSALGILYRACLVF